MGLIKRVKRHYIIKSYLRELPPLLVKKYGKKKYYTQEQIQKMAKKGRLNQDYICYAYASFMDAHSFGVFHRSEGKDCDYGEMREEVADGYLNGDRDFSFETILAGAYASSGISAFSSGNSDNVGGNDMGSGGGDGGGGGGGD